MIAPLNPEEEVKSKQIVVPDQAKFRAKLSQFIADGAENLQVVADFDHTFTRYHFNGRQYFSTFGAMQSILTPEQTSACQALFDHYHPIEINSSISFLEKFALMDEWHDASSAVMMQVPFSKEQLRKVLDSDRLLLRHGVNELMTLCKEQFIKFTIVSAGLGNVIDLCLEHVTASDIAEVYANVIEFDDHGMSSNFKEPRLHSLSKSTILASKSLRKNILLLGDMPHDLLMVGHHSQDSVLSIGFFNDANKFKISDYQDKFDILCLQDGNLGVAELLIAWISGVERSIEESPSLNRLLEYRVG